MQTLAERVAVALGRPTVRLEPAPGGALHSAYVVHADERPIAFLRVEGTSGPAEPGSEVDAGFGLRREAGVLRSLHAQGLPVPELLAALDDPAGLVLELIGGTSRPDPEEAERVGPEFMTLIARVHDLDPADFPVPQFGTLADAVDGELRGWWGRAVEGGSDRQPLVRLGRRVLGATATRSTEPPTFLHGDVGAGNFMVADGRVTALLDWETAHAGDPHEDLAWLWMRGAHTSFGDPEQRFREYGRPIDRARLDWNVALVMWKSVLATEGALLTRSPDDGQVVRTVVALAYGSLLASALGRVLGVSLPALAEEPVRAPSVLSRLVEYVGRADLPRGQVLAVEHLQDALAQGEWEQRRLREDAIALLGRPLGDAAAEIDGAGDDALPALVEIYGRAAHRAAQASSKAVRRIQRAQAIGLGLGLDSGRPTEAT
ncbi:MAG: aminoglycoside phosphotransferase [Frankiales bacterium]|nr:aminoglycoside phosphotransferase [Frankiales bacterium]